MDKSAGRRRHDEVRIKALSDAALFYAAERTRLRAECTRLRAEVSRLRRELIIVRAAWDELYRVARPAVLTENRVDATC